MTCKKLEEKKININSKQIFIEKLVMEKLSFRDSNGLI